MAKIKEMDTKKLQKVIKEGQRELKKRKRLKEQDDPKMEVRVNISYFDNITNQPLIEVANKMEDLLSGLDESLGHYSDKTVEEKVRDILEECWRPGKIIEDFHDTLDELREAYDESNEENVKLIFT